MIRRSAIAIGIVTSALAHVSEKRQDIAAPASCGMKCLVPALYGACPSNDTLCLCKTSSVIQGVGSCVIDACTVQDERDATIQYMLSVCQSFGVTVPIPSAFLSFIPSTLSPSHSASLISTPTERSTPRDVPPPPEPNIVAIVGAVIGIIIAMFIGVVVFICWRRRRRRAHIDTRTQGARPRGILGRLMVWRTGTLSRADTVSSWFGGREEKDDPSKGLLPKVSQRVLPSQQSSDPKFGDTSRDANATSPPHVENQLTPPPPPPSYLKPIALGSMREDWMREDWMRRASSPAPPASLSGNPFTTPPHSRTSSYDPSGRYPDGAFSINSLPPTAISNSTPFSGVKPFLIPDRNTPPSSASSPGGLQEIQLEWAAREHWVAPEGSASHALARPISATLHSDAGPISPENAAKGMHKRNLTIETANLGASRSTSDTQKKSIETTVAATGAPVNPMQDGASPNDRANSNSDEDAAGRVELQKMFACDTPSSDYEMHESMCERFQTTPTEGCQELHSPAAPESATMEMFGIGFGAMGGKWEPRSSDSTWSSNDAGVLARLPSKKSRKSIKTPVGPMRIQHTIKRGASVLSTSASSSHGDETPLSFDQRWEMANEKSPAHHTSGPSAPQARETIFEVDENVPPVPGMPPMSGGNAPTSTPSRGGGTHDTREPAHSAGERQGSNLTPRTAPPRQSVVPDDFSSEEGLGLSRANTRKWL